MSIKKLSGTSIRQSLVSKATVPTSTGQTFTNIQTYNYSGSNQTFSIPAGVTKIICHLWGAAGGGANAEGYSDQGGPGGYTYGILDVSSISSLVIQVGQGGTRQSSSRTARVYPNAGFGGTRGSYIQGNGGGRSAIFNGSVSFANALLIAGGGGGGSGHGGGAAYQTMNCGGSPGGGLVGINTTGGYNSLAGGGGTQSAGGTNATDVSPTQTSGQLAGGDHGNGTAFESGGANTGGGGGDGYYGGGAGLAHGGGGGGSGYIHPTLIIDGQTLSSGGQLIGKNSGPFNPPNTSSPYWSSGIGVSGSNVDGGNGKIVLIY